MRNKDEKLARRTILAAAGMILTGISIGFFKRSGFGVDPYQCFANGLANIIPIDFGTLYMLINMLQLVIVFFMAKHYIGISTFINMFLLGYMVEISENALAAWFGELALTGRIAFLVIGVVITCFAAALYYTAALGVSTYDAIPLHIAEMQPKVFGKVVPFRAVRITTDCICTIIGILLGATAGIGTVVTALFMGPLITYFKRHVTDRMLNP